jgi:hypothetical protein
MHRRDEPAAFLTLLVIGLLAAQLAILAMAACPSLHMWLHHDAGEPDHQCAVTAVIAGQLDFFVATVVTFLSFAVGLVATRTLVRVPRPFSALTSSNTLLQSASLVVNDTKQYQTEVYLRHRGLVMAYRVRGIQEQSHAMV